MQRIPTADKLVQKAQKAIAARSIGARLVACAIALSVFAGLFVGALVPSYANALELAKNWQLGLPEPASPIARQIFDLHNNILLPMSFAICLFVFALGGFICWRFSEKRNKKPSKRTHNLKLEVVWTIIPIIILVILFVPSLKLLRSIDDLTNSAFSVKATGHQWYWSYEYPDHDGFSFDSNLLSEDELKDKSKRLLKTDNALVLPVGQKVRLLITSVDVLHSWAVPMFGVKMDAVPGKLNETWVQVDKPGVYYGFCTELCGHGHAYMPVEVHAVSKGEFAVWLRDAKKRFAKNNPDKSNSHNFALAVKK